METKKDNNIYKCDLCVHKKVCKNYPIDSLPPTVRTRLFQKLNDECLDYLPTFTVNDLTVIELNAIIEQQKDLLEQYYELVNKLKTGVEKDVKQNGKA